MKSELESALKNNVFWGFGPCNVVKIYWRFGATDRFRLHGLYSPLCESPKSQKVAAAPPKVKFHIAPSYICGKHCKKKIHLNVSSEEDTVVVNRLSSRRDLCV